MGAYQTEYNAGPSATLKAGMIPRFDGRGPQVISLLNNSKAAQVTTLEVTSTSYALTLSLGGVSRSFSGSGFGTAALAAADLKDAIEADGIAGSWVSLSLSSATITATARHAGTDYAVTYSGETNVTVTETTSASDGETIGFGLAVMHASTEGECERPTATSATAEVWTLTPAAANATDYYAGCSLADDPATTYVASYLSDADATVQEIVEGLQTVLAGILPASVAVATEDDTKITLTGPSSGVSIRPVAGSSNASATWTVAQTVAGSPAALTRPIAGFAVRSEHVGAVVDFSGGEGSEPTEYPAGGDVAVLEAGVIVCETDDTVSRFDPVYVRVTATGNEKVGSVRNDADGGDCILLSGARFLEAASGTAAAHAPVKVQLDLSTVTA